jgi:hypothetical protein
VLCVHSNECEVPFIGKEGRWSAWGHMPGAAESGGATGPMIHRLSPWTPLITAPKAVVGHFLGSVSPDTSVDRCGRPSRCGRPISVPCDAPPLLRDA